MELRNPRLDVFHHWRKLTHRKTATFVAHQIFAPELLPFTISTAFNAYLVILHSPLEPDPKKLATLRSDITLSACEVKVKSRKCTKTGCGEGSIDVTAVTDFIEDGDRTSRIATARVRGTGTYGWQTYDPPDIEVHMLYFSFVDFTFEYNHHAEG